MSFSRPIHWYHSHTDPIWLDSTCKYFVNSYCKLSVCGFRYEDQDVNGNQAIFLNAGRKPEDCKMVARALFSFQVRAAMQVFGAKI
jgi:hypothetical protein